MELVKDKWNSIDIAEFYELLESMKNDDRIEWTKRNINTKMNLLAIKIPVLKKIASEIYKGNFLSFLDQKPYKYFESIAICGFLIPKIDNFEIMKQYLKCYSEKADNWSLTDELKFKTKNKEDLFFNLSNEYLKSHHPFQRRIGFIILFCFVNDEKYLAEILKIIDCFYFEENYYVNMIIAWIICEMFIKHRNRTLKYLKNHNLNTFTINKAVQKCRDSFRVSDDDKKMLLSFRR